MAFKSISSGNQTDGDALYTTKLAVGESYTGYPVERRIKEDDSRKANLVMQLESGEKKLIFTSGNAAYKAAEMPLGVLTRITRIEDGIVTNKQTKKSMKSSKFEIEQDDEKTLEDAQFSGVFAEAPVNTPAVAVSGVAARAAALTAAAKANKRA